MLQRVSLAMDQTRKALVPFLGLEASIIVISKQFLDVSMLLAQDLDDVCHRYLPRTALQTHWIVNMNIIDAH